MYFCDETSDSQHVTYGVPQGSIRGLLLVIVFMNDMPLVTNNGPKDNYADDFTTHIKAKTIDKLESKLHSDLVNISQ